MSTPETLTPSNPLHFPKQPITSTLMDFTVAVLPTTHMHWTKALPIRRKRPIGPKNLHSNLKKQSQMREAKKKAMTKTIWITIFYPLRWPASKMLNSTWLILLSEIIASKRMISKPNVQSFIWQSQMREAKKKPLPKLFGSQHLSIEMTSHQNVKFNLVDSFV